MEVPEEAGREDRDDFSGPLGERHLGRAEVGEVVGHGLPSGEDRHRGRPYEGTTPAGSEVSGVGGRAGRDGGWGGHVWAPRGVAHSDLRRGDRRLSGEGLWMC
jgi:hypothetical protein